ncbi:Rho GTPase activation protein [Daldinia vernicosa]|uniref:Rho GTPase activation protein n=1 Tax=Daldinia vernicosa TaxID=114800 RepID=UPI002007AB71|nr:Rho GTPase activation protein [Daldinia vernicosa]KAI0844012.1 Rho GTPase activation protein [Daldinia vernicosa]
MESLSITSDCITLGNAIFTANIILNGFVREVREARSDVDGVSRELHSLQSVLDLLNEDASLFPPDLAEHIPAVLEHCSRLVNELDTSISSLNSNELSRQDKRSQWLATGRQQVATFRTALEAHKAVLGLALDLAGATTIRDITSDVEPNRRNTIERHQNSAAVMEDVSRVLVEMSQVRMRLPGEFEKNETEFSLYDYMTRLKSYAEKIISVKESEHEVEQSIKEADETADQGAFMGDKKLFGAYIGDKPDSAIDVSVESASKSRNDVQADPEDEKIPTIEELMASFVGIPSRAPTPPPKDSKRRDLARSLMVSPFEATPDFPDNSYGVVTEIVAQGPPAESPPSITKSRGFGKFFAPLKHAISENRPQTRSTTSTNATDIQPATPIIQASLVRRGSHRLSVSFKRLPMWNSELIMNEPEDTAPNAVFGVPLQKSMQVAKGTSKTHHSGHGGSSRRDFPLCMQKCCFFLKNEGVEAPDIFAEPGDSYRVQKLKDIFSSGPTYGEDVNWTNFGVYDAADLILLFLSQLPKPLIAENIAKQWIALSRQAMLSGSHATRLDRCIDFWEEALGGLRGPSRTLFKLLLNLWADIAQAEEKNDMTAERLAGVLIKPLMHITSTKYETDFMLSLAFLIRRRVEYTELLKKDQADVKRISRAAW